MYNNAYEPDMDFVVPYLLINAIVNKVCVIHACK